MSGIRIRCAYTSAGFMYSVVDCDSGNMKSYFPGSQMPFITDVPFTATTAARPVRAWLLTASVTIEDVGGGIIAEGVRGDYLIEGEYGDFTIVKGLSIRDEYDLAGDVSRVYRTPSNEIFFMTDCVFGVTSHGVQF